VNFTPNSSRQLVQSTIRVNVVDGRLSVTNASGAINNKIGFIRIAPAGATPTPAPTPITSNWPISWRSAATPSVARFESYAFSHGGKTYVLGGWEDGFTGSERNEVFNPATNTWRRLRDIPIPQTHAGFALDERNGVAYAVAGYRGDLPSALTNEFWKYTISTDTWSRMPINAPIKGGAGAAVVMNNKLYHFGGVKDGPDTNTGNHYVLDLSRVSDGWKQLATLPTGRDHLSGVALNGYLYAIGGELGHDRLHAQQKLVHRYNPATNTWARMADLPTAKSHAESSVFVLNGKIVMAGGQVDPQSATREVVQYDPARNAWSRLMSLPAARQGVVVLPAGRYIVVTTGSAYGTFQEQKTTWVGVLS
ncbi:MAG TPA: hypothetical protein VGB55_04600, partial [Tepidisphaeraceae bacterium]